MFFKEKAQAAAQEILSAFEEGTIPQALAQVFIHRNHDVPARRWSYSNRLIAALRGHYDARGFRQWKEVGRHVKAGERAFHILVPHKVTAKEDDVEKGIKAGDAMVVGFLSAAVFGYSQTDGETLPGEEEEASFDELGDSGHQGPLVRLDPSRRRLDDDEAVDMVDPWDQPDVRRAVLARLPGYRLSKFQDCLPERFALKVLERYLLDVEGRCGD